MLDLSRLSPEQRQAVLAGDGPLLIVAGPGSGKTTVLAARIAYLVTCRNVPATSILTIAFATKAKRALQARLGALLGAQGREVDVTTFHGFGLRIVREWSEKLGFRPGRLVVYSRDESWALLSELAEGLGIDQARWPLHDLSAALERYRLGDPGMQIPDQVRMLARTYDDALRRRGAIDYSAMLALPLQLFAARPDVLRLYQDNYRHMLADEFQDVCAAQYTLLRLLAEHHRNLVVVGDPLQTLYGWRGADVRFLVDFQREFPEARIVSLDQNFRSTGRIVDLANTLSAALPYSRPLWTDNPSGETALLHVAPDERAEAAFVATEITKLLATGLIDHPGEVSVLYRTNQQAHELVLALRERHLPYVVRANGDLFVRREVRDAVAYLRLIHDPCDGIALTRIVNVPPRRLGRLTLILHEEPTTLERLPVLAQRYGPRAAAGARALYELIRHLHAQSEELAPAVLLDRVLEQTGYSAWLDGQPDGPSRLAHLAMLRSLVERVEGGLGTWLAELQLDEELLLSRDDARRVVLTTIHGAKGGEWRVVFVTGVEEELLPHTRSLITDGPGNTWLDEELRVAYVAVTRPRERLYLTCCRSRRRGARSEARHPSRFLRGLPVVRAA